MSQSDAMRGMADGMPDFHPEQIEWLQRFQHSLNDIRRLQDPCIDTDCAIAKATGEIAAFDLLMSLPDIRRKYNNAQPKHRLHFLVGVIASIQSIIGLAKQRGDR